MRLFEGDYTGKNKEKFLELINNATSKPIDHESYDSKSSKEKIEYIKAIKKDIYAVLEFLSKP